MSERVPTCRVCSKSFATFPDLKQHIREENHHDVNLTKSGPNFAPSTFADSKPTFTNDNGGVINNLVNPWISQPPAQKSIFKQNSGERNGSFKSFDPNNKQQLSFNTPTNSFSSSNSFEFHREDQPPRTDVVTKPIANFSEIFSQKPKDPLSTLNSATSKPIAASTSSWGSNSFGNVTTPALTSTASQGSNQLSTPTAFPSTLPFGALKSSTPFVSSDSPLFPNNSISSFAAKKSDPFASATSTSTSSFSSSTPSRNPASLKPLSASSSCDVKSAPGFAGGSGEVRGKRDAKVAQRMILNTLGIRVPKPAESATALGQSNPPSSFHHTSSFASETTDPFQQRKASPTPSPLLTSSPDGLVQRPFAKPWQAAGQQQHQQNQQQQKKNPWRPNSPLKQSSSPRSSPTPGINARAPPAPPAATMPRTTTASGGDGTRPNQPTPPVARPADPPVDSAPSHFKCAQCEMSFSNVSEWSAHFNRWSCLLSHYHFAIFLLICICLLYVVRSTKQS